jgi:hypothetical protein
MAGTPGKAEDGMSGTFADACLEGEATVDQVDDWVDRWHAGEGAGRSLGEFLGLTAAQSRAWVERPDSLADALLAKARGRIAFTQQWYAERFERLRGLCREAGVEDQFCNIVANGTASALEPPTYAQQLNRTLHRAEKAEARIKALEAGVRRLVRDELAAKTPPAPDPLARSLRAIDAGE